MTSNFAHLKKYIEELYPQVKSFEVYTSAFTIRIDPIEYYDGATMKEEYPPVARWKINEQRFSYVLRPEFKPVERRSWFSRRTGYEPDYSHETETILNVVRWSVEGLTDLEINMKLHGRPAP